MNDKTIAHYAKIKVLENCPNSKVRGKLGTVLGTSEDDNGAVSSYAVALHDADILYMFDKNDVVATGKVFAEQDYY